jgi:hypothetical protein
MNKHEQTRGVRDLPKPKEFICGTPFLWAKLRRETLDKYLGTERTVMPRDRYERIKFLERLETVSSRREAEAVNQLWEQESMEGGREP